MNEHKEWDKLHTVLSFGVGFMALAAVICGFTGFSQRDAALDTVTTQKATIADLRDDITVLEDEVAETSDDLSDCQDEAAAWQSSGAAMIASFQAFLDGYPLDLSDATRYAEDANAIDCI